MRLARPKAAPAWRRYASSRASGRKRPIATMRLASLASRKSSGSITLLIRRAPSRWMERVLVVEREGGDECLLRHFDAADLLHPLLAFLLAVEKLALARDVAPVALGDDVLALRLHRFAGNDAAADRGLNRDVEQLTRDELTQLLGHASSVVVGLVLVHDGR